MIITQYDKGYFIIFTISTFLLFYKSNKNYFNTKYHLFCIYSFKNVTFYNMLDNRVGGASRLRPLTPPYVRIRIRRFNILRKQTLPFRLGILSPSGGVFRL